MAKLLDIVKPGVVTGEDVQKIFAYAKANNFAIPAVNCVGSDSVNAVLETAARVKAPVIIQFVCNPHLSTLLSAFGIARELHLL